MKLCSHIVMTDTGLAPNPFHGYCTSALCTPSHMGVRRLERGDWLIGTTSAADGNKLLYAMRISEVMTLKRYSEDQRFTAKKPRGREGPPENQCGDNIYYQTRGVETPPVALSQ